MAFVTGCRPDRHVIYGFVQAGTARLVARRANSRRSSVNINSALEGGVIRRIGLVVAGIAGCIRCHVVG